MRVTAVKFLIASATLLGLAACVSQGGYAAAPQRFVPPGGQVAWMITGRIDETEIDNIDDVSVTIMINDQLAAVGGFSARKGAADASFVGAYGGSKLTVHCTGSNAGTGYACDIALGAQHAATLAFLPIGK